MNDPILPLPGLSPAGGKAVVVKFDGGLLSSDGGVLALREVERRLRVADRLACCPDGRLALIAAKMASRALMPRLRLSRFRDFLVSPRLFSHHEWKVCFGALGISRPQVHVFNRL